MSDSLGQVVNPAETRMPLDLKLFYAFVTLLAVGMVALLAFWRPADAAPARPQKLDQPRYLGAFSLTDQTGRTLTQADVAGNFLVVNFIHTSCSISCLRVNQQMAEVQRLTEGQGDVQLLSFTVDPRTDTPEVLREFGKQFGTDANRWQMLTGDKGELYDLIETSFLKRDRLASDPGMPGGFKGVERIAVVDRAGRVRHYFDGMRPTAAVAIVKLLDELRAESK